MSSSAPISSTSSAGAADRAPVVSVLLVNYNSWQLCAGALESLVENPPADASGAALPFEVVVVDNASPQHDPDGQARVAALVQRIGGELILHGENGGYSKGMNLAYRHARGRYLLVSNPDVFFLPDCLTGLLRHLESDPTCGAAAPENFWDRGLACRLPPNILPTLRDLWTTTMAHVSPRAVVSYSRRRTAEAVRVWDAEAPVELDMLSGCCFLMERSFVERIGLFDERFPLYYEDTDLSLRIRRAGRRVVQVYGARLVHLYNRSGQTDQGQAMQRYWVSRRAYYRKWYGPVGGWLIDLSRRFLSSEWAKRRSSKVAPRVLELEPSTGKPVLELPRHCQRFVVEISLDPRFFLAGGVYGSGDRWTPSDRLFFNFGPTTYYFRVCDLSSGVPEQIGIYRYERLMPDAWKQASGDG